MECYAARHGKIKTEPQKHFINDSDKRKRKAVMNDCKTCNTAKSIEPRSFAIHDTNRTLCFLALFETELGVFFPVEQKQGEFAKNLHPALFHTKTCCQVPEKLLKISPYIVGVMQVISLLTNRTKFNCFSLIIFLSNLTCSHTFKSVALRYCNDAFLFFLEQDRCGQCKL